jgi:hypothetical protein
MSKWFELGFEDPIAKHEDAACGVSPSIGGALKSGVRPTKEGGRVEVCSRGGPQT